MNIIVLEYKQRRLIVHSFIYYELNSNIWEDSQYDELALLLEAQKDTEQWKQSRFYSIFKDWDSSSGYPLIRRDLDDYYYYFRALGERLLNQ